MKVHIKLGHEGTSYMHRCASIRRTSVTGLCERLIETIARDEMVLAVLDDDSRPIEGRNYRYRSPRIYKD